MRQVFVRRWIWKIGERVGMGRELGGVFCVVDATYFD